MEIDGLRLISLVMYKQKVAALNLKAAGYLEPNLDRVLEYREIVQAILVEMGRANGSMMNYEDLYDSMIECQVEIQEDENAVPAENKLKAWSDVVKELTAIKERGKWPIEF